MVAILVSKEMRHLHNCFKNTACSLNSPNYLTSEFAERFEQLLAVVDDDEIVVVHHDGQRLADDDGQPDHQVSAARTPLPVHISGYVGQRNLRGKKLSFTLL